MHSICARICICICIFSCIYIYICICIFTFILVSRFVCLSLIRNAANVFQFPAGTVSSVSSLQWSKSKILLWFLLICFGLKSLLLLSCQCLRTPCASPFYVTLILWFIRVTWPSSWRTTESRGGQTPLTFPTDRKAVSQGSFKQYLIIKSSYVI